MEYRNFDIFIEEKTAEGYLLKAQAGDSGEARSHFSLDLSTPEIQKTLTQLGNHQVDKDTQIKFGLLLYSHIFKEDIERVFHEYSGQIFENGKTGIRIRLRIYPPEIASIPWELLFSPITKQFLATSESYPLVRYIELPQSINELETTFPVHILAAIPEYSANYFPLDTSSEKKSLLEALEELKDNVSIDFIEGKVTRKKITDALMDHPFHCLHFIGHGDFSNDQGTLLLNSEDGEVDPIDDVQFASLVQNHPSMKLVVLNSCKGAEISTIQPMVGMAPKLVQNGIPAVVAMQYAIYDEAAVSFAREFYRKLFRGYEAGRVDIAMSHARNILGVNPSTQNDMCTPVLFMRSATGTLFDLKTGAILKDIPIRRQSFYTAQSAVELYSYNQSIEQNSEDYEGLKDLRQRIRYGRYAVSAVIVAVVVIFSLFWVKAFDLLTLDTKSEALIMGLGDKLAPKAISNELALIGFITNKGGNDWREKWRRQHALLIGKLSRAGTKVIVFDINFSSEFSTSADSELVNSINTAKLDGGTTTILGYKNLRNNDFSKPLLNDSILSSQAHTGLVVAGRKMSLARSIVLAAKKKDSNDKWVSEYSVVLKAYSAFKQEKVFGIDAKNMQIMMDGNNINISEYKEVRGHQKGVIQKGDYVAQNYIDYLPIMDLRNEQHSHFYEAVLNQYDEQKLEEDFKGKIVLIGEKNSTDQFGILSVFGLDRFGYELLAEAINSLLKGRTIKKNNATVTFFLMVLSGILGAFLRYYIQFHYIASRMALLIIISAIYLAVTIYVYTELLILINVIYHVSVLFFSYWITGRLIQRRQI